MKDVELVHIINMMDNFKGKTAVFGNFYQFINENYHKEWNNVHFLICIISIKMVG